MAISTEAISSVAAVSTVHKAFCVNAYCHSALCKTILCKYCPFHMQNYLHKRLHKAPQRCFVQIILQLNATVFAQNRLAQFVHRFLWKYCQAVRDGVNTIAVTLLIDSFSILGCYMTCVVLNRFWESLASQTLQMTHIESKSLEKWPLR